MQKTLITIYTTESDPHIEKVKEFIKEKLPNNVWQKNVSIIDISKNEEEKDYLINHGIRYVPVIKIKNKLIIGYQEKPIEDQIALLKL